MTELVEVRRKGRQTPSRGVWDETLPSHADNPNIANLLTKSWGFTLLDWQNFVLRNSLSVAANKNFAFKNIGLSVARQNGKTEIIEARAALALTAWGENAIYSSYLDVSSYKIWERFLNRLEKAIENDENMKRMFPVLPSRKVKNRVIQSFHPVTGEKFGQLRFITRKGGAGRGESDSLIFIDEAQDLSDGEHDAMIAGVATHPNAQIWYVGTADPVESAASKGTTADMGRGPSTFSGIRRSALNKEVSRTAWFEWGVDSLRPRTDKEAWYEANPSLGFYFGNTGQGYFEEELESVLGSDVSFAVERLNFWSSQEREAAIEISRWNDNLIDKEKSKEFMGGSVHLAIKSDPNGERVEVAVAIRKPTGEIFVEIFPGYDTDKPWLSEFSKTLLKYIENSRCRAIVVDGVYVQAQVRSVLESKGKWSSMKAGKKQGKTMMVNAGDLSGAISYFIGAVNEGSVYHLGQKRLDAAISDAGKRPFRGGGFAIRSISGKTSSIAVEAVALAVNEASKSRIVSNNNSESNGMRISNMGGVSSMGNIKSIVN